MIKYIMNGVPLRLGFICHDDRVIFGLKVFDDGKDGALLWSVLEHENEKKAVFSLSLGATCRVFLYNELAVNVAYTNFEIQLGKEFSMVSNFAHLGKFEYFDYNTILNDSLELLHKNLNNPQGELVFDLKNERSWVAIKNTFITSKGRGSLLDILSAEEGLHQEELGIWLSDNLAPGKVYHGPVIPPKKGGVL